MKFTLHIECFKPLEDLISENSWLEKIHFVERGESAVEERIVGRSMNHAGEMIELRLAFFHQV